MLVRTLFRQASQNQSTEVLLVCSSSESRGPWTVCWVPAGGTRRWGLLSEGTDAEHCQRGGDQKAVVSNQRMFDRRQQVFHVFTPFCCLKTKFLLCDQTLDDLLWKQSWELSLISIECMHTVYIQYTYSIRMVYIQSMYSIHTVYYMYIQESQWEDSYSNKRSKRIGSHCTDVTSQTTASKKSSPNPDDEESRWWIQLCLRSLKAH